MQVIDYRKWFKSHYALEWTQPNVKHDVKNRERVYVYSGNIIGKHRYVLTIRIVFATGDVSLALVKIQSESTIEAQICYGFSMPSDGLMPTGSIPDTIDTMLDNADYWRFVPPSKILSRTAPAMNGLAPPNPGGGELAYAS